MVQSCFEQKYCRKFMLDISMIHRLQVDFWRLFCCLLLLFFTVNVFALETETLPQAISTSSIKLGYITGLDERYEESGNLVKLKDYKSVQFDAPTIARFNPQAATLVQTLNRFGLYNAGDLFNLGTLEFEAHPTIKYIAPTYAYGINNQWTVGLGLPVIEYSNEIQMTQSLSNMDYYNQFRGLSDDLDAALDTDLREATQSALAQKGYLPIENRNEKFLGDIQLVSVFKVFDTGDSKLIHQATLTLPTGPTYNSDDLLALNVFHKTSLENLIGYAKVLGSFLTVSPFVSMKYVLPENILVRVPKNSEDTLPDQNSKDQVTLNEGISSEVGTQLDFDLTQDFKISTDYRFGQKTQDSYSASNKGDSTLLAKNTNSLWQKISLSFSYSTVKSYLKKQSLLPMSLTFLAYDTISGLNVERRTGQELSVALFF